MGRERYLISSGILNDPQTHNLHSKLSAHRAGLDTSAELSEVIDKSRKKARPVVDSESLANSKHFVM